MNLHEYQAKQLFAEFGIPVPEGQPATDPAGARAAAEALGGGRWVVKAQVHAGGRGKGGGVKLVESPQAASEAAAAMLGMQLVTHQTDAKGLPVHTVLVEKAGSIARELYVSLLTDRASESVVFMASAAGGMDIEQVAEETPEKIFTVHIDTTLGVRSYQTTYLAHAMGFPKELWREFHNIVVGLYACFKGNDASLTEVNPLVLTGAGKLMALDGKMSIDDNSLFRQQRLAEMRDVDEEPASEREARLAGINFIKLDGNIGCMVNGAGLAMTTMDVVKLFGGEPANFLDIGGGARADQVATAIKLILSDPNVEAVLINIFGGITRGDEVARGILAALELVQTNVPMVVRLAGTNAQEGLEILQGAEMITAVTLSDAAQKAVAAAKGAK